MAQNYFDYDKYSDVFKKAQEPMQALIDLNIKTLQNYQYMKPEELSKTSKPDELLQKQLKIAMANGHEALQYLQNAFEIVEKVVLSFAKDVKSDSAK